MLRGLCSGRGFGDALGAPDRGGTLEDTGEEEQPLTLTSGVSAGPHSEIPPNYLHFNLAFNVLDQTCNVFFTGNPNFNSSPQTFAQGATSLLQVPCPYVRSYHTRS